MFVSHIFIDISGLLVVQYQYLLFVSFSCLSQLRVMLKVPSTICSEVGGFRTSSQEINCHYLFQRQISYIVPLHYPLTKATISDLTMLVVLVWYCLPINQNNFLVGFLWIYIFHAPFQQRIYFFTQWEIFLSCSLWCLWKQSNGSPTFSSNFYQGIV